jgi:hypothetical protein
VEVGLAVGAGVWVGRAVVVGSAVGGGALEAVGAGVGCPGGAVAGSVVGWVGPGVSPLGSSIGPTVGVAFAGARLGFTAVIVLDGVGGTEPVGDVDGEIAGGEAVSLAEGALVACVAAGDAEAPGDWPAAVLPLGCAGPTIGEVGMPNVPTANAMVARARFRMPRATTRRARWADVTAIRDSRTVRHDRRPASTRGGPMVPEARAGSTRCGLLWCGPAPQIQLASRAS